MKHYKKELKDLREKLEDLENKIEEKTVKTIIKEQRLEWGRLSDVEMDWEEAKEWCTEQGKGWRLPTISELFQAYCYKVDGFGTGYHWSSTEYSITSAKLVTFSVGGVNNYNKTTSYSVRCVRSLT